MKFFKLYIFLFFLTGCIGSPIGGPNSSSSTNCPYFITTDSIVIKKILVTAGTKLIYEKQFFKRGKQNKMMSEKKLNEIEFPTVEATDWGDVLIGETEDWGGVPITHIKKFINPKMIGFSVYADFKYLSNDKATKFSKLWQSCNHDLGITVMNIDDWSFNTKNISDIESCGAFYQRYFKEDETRQSFLDDMYKELIKIGSK